MTYPEHRKPVQIEFDAQRGADPEIIDAYNHGYQWNIENFAPGHNRYTAMEALKNSPYHLMDETPKGNAFWKGFEEATMDAISNLMSIAKSGFDPVAEAEQFLRED